MAVEGISSYIDLGYNIYGISGTTIVAAFTSSSESDAYTELGEYSVSDLNVSNLTANKISGGTITAVTNLGGESIELDGEEGAIKIYDDEYRLQVLIQGD